MSPTAMQKGYGKFRLYGLLCGLLLTLGGYAAEGDEEVARISVQINGLNDVLADNAYNHLTAVKPACDAGQWQRSRYARQARERLTRSLQAFGHYVPDIQHEYVQNETCRQLLFTVDPGPQVKLRTVTIEIAGDGRQADKLVEQQQETLLVPGHALRHSEYTQFKNSLLATSNGLGYLDAAYTQHQLDIYPDALAADITLQLQTGAQYRLGDVQFEQSEVVLKESVLQQLVAEHREAVYSQELLSEMRETLSMADYYQQIDFVTQVDAEQHVVNITVQLEPAAKYEYTVGVGVSTDVGPRLRLGYDNYRVNTAGDRYSISGIFSGIGQELTFVYHQLGRNPARDRWKYSAGLKREDIDAGESTTASIGAAYSTEHADGWFNTRSLEWLYEDFQEQDREFTTALLIPGYSWSYSHSDRPFYTTRGFRTNMTLKGADEQLLSDASFVSLYADAKWIRAFGERSRVILRGGMGAISTSDLDELPLSLKYFAGGDNSIRGYSYKSIGPEDDSGRLIGGKYLALLSGEFEYRIKGDWGAAIFADTGDAFTDDFDLKRGVGIGVRWYSPIGPLRIDLGHGLDDPDNTVQLHFSLGQDI